MEIYSISWCIWAAVTKNIINQTVNEKKKFILKFWRLGSPRSVDLVPTESPFLDS
jgi:hypothetical protein